MNKVRIAAWTEIEPGGLVRALVAGVDLVVVRWPDGEGHSVLYGRCVRRGALMADGHVDGDNLVIKVTFEASDNLTTFHREMADLSGVAFGGP